MTFQEAKEEMNAAQREWDKTPRFERTQAQWDRIIRSQTKVDQMLSEMSREMDMEKFDKEAENA